MVGSVAAIDRPHAGLPLLGRRLRLPTLALRAACRVHFCASALLSLARTDLRDPLGVRDFEQRGRPRLVIEIRHRDAWQAPADGAFDISQAPLFFRGHQSSKMEVRSPLSGS